jgi:predicted nucleic acid-binding protein
MLDTNVLISWFLLRSDLVVYKINQLIASESIIYVDNYCVNELANIIINKLMLNSKNKKNFG